MYLVESNLYGYAMSEYLPYSRFKWLNQKEINRSDVYSIGENSSIGYILEVDVNYLDDVHELHNDYALVSKKLEISQKMYQKIAVILQMNME